MHSETIVGYASWQTGNKTEPNSIVYFTKNNGTGNVYRKTTTHTYITHMLYL